MKEYICKRRSNKGTQVHFFIEDNIIIGEVNNEEYREELNQESYNPLEEAIIKILSKVDEESK